MTRAGRRSGQSRGRSWGERPRALGYPPEFPLATIALFAFTPADTDILTRLIQLISNRLRTLSLGMTGHVRRKGAD